MKVVYVGSPPLFTRGASAIHVMKMCQAMSRLGVEVELVIPSFNSNQNPFEYYNVEPNFRLTTLPSFKYNTTARHIAHGAVSAVYTRFKRKELDLVITRNMFYAYLAANSFNIPTIYDAHHPPVDRVALLVFKSFKDSDNLLRFSTNSQGLGDIYLSLGLKQEKLVVAHNGVDLEEFEPILSKEEARKQVGLPIEKKIVCYCGNTYSGRGIELLIEASVKLKDVLFLVVGGLESDNDRYRSIAQSKRAENFSLVGFVPHKSVNLYLLSADVLVMPYTSIMTIRDGTTAMQFTSPIKLFEYMASCRPIVATALPSVKEILVDGSNGLLAEPDSLDSLVDSIKRVLENTVLAEKLAMRAQFDVKKYTWEERVKKILNGLYGL